LTDKKACANNVYRTFVRFWALPANVDVKKNNEISTSFLPFFVLQAYFQPDPWENDPI